MLKGQTLRALVTERLAAAAEEIFVLFERTISEYEEELCRSKEENRRKQLLLDKVLTPRIELVRQSVQIPSASPSPGLSSEITESPPIKEEPEEQSVKTEEEQLPVFVPVNQALQIRQRQTDHAEDVRSEPRFLPEPEGHAADEDDWEALCTEADGKVKLRAVVSGPELLFCPPDTTARSEDASGADGRKHRCPFCTKSFSTKQILKRHIRVHTGEKPFSCAVCRKTFVQKCDLNIHARTHTGEKPYSCPVCKKTFSQKGNLDAHSRTHTGEKPYSCPVCNKAYSANRLLKTHLSVHHRTRQSPAHLREPPRSCFSDFSEQIIII